MKENFFNPYTAENITVFWRKWHISLSLWLRDYIYIPLGGNRKGIVNMYIFLFITMLVGGIWHGANWTFIVWGGIHAALFLPLLLRGKNRRYTSDTIGEGRWLPTGREFLGMAWTFSMVCVAWVFFRAESVGEAVEYLFLLDDFDLPIIKKKPLAIIAPFVLFDIIIYKVEFLSSSETNLLRKRILDLILIITILLWEITPTEFIYFAF